MSSEVLGLCDLDLRPVASDTEQPSHESAEDLREDVVRDLPPGEALPESETNRDGRVEVSTRYLCTSDNGKSDTESECEADLEDAAEDCDTDAWLAVCTHGDWVCCCEGEAGYGCDAWEDVEEDTGGFTEHLAEDSRA